MSTLVATLADLHRRYDGPIDLRLREAVLNGRRRSGGWMLSLASRDLDQLALSNVLARARLRAGTCAPADDDGLDHDANAVALADALLWYRNLGVRTMQARNVLGQTRPVEP